KEPCREAWRRSWGSAASGGSAGDDLWPLLQHHYDYIMDNQIIDSCKWSLVQLIAEFNELCQWLTHVQEEIYSSPENLVSRQLRMWLTHMQEEIYSSPENLVSRQLRMWLTHVQEEIYSSPDNLVSRQLRMWLTHVQEEIYSSPENLVSRQLRMWLTHMQEEIYSSPENLVSRQLRMNRMAELCSVERRREKFIEQGNAILDRIPEASADVNTAAHELHCLRRWLHRMEGRLPPPSLAAARCWTYHELLTKLREH
ncbi:Uncharacterized protein OBRU01_19836, partial [Operophtera brumata]